MKQFLKQCVQREGGREINGADLARDGVVSSDLGVSIRDELEINDGGKSVVEDLAETVHDEIGAVGAKSLVVQNHRNLLTIGIGGTQVPRGRQGRIDGDQKRQ